MRIMQTPLPVSDNGVEEVSNMLRSLGFDDPPMMFDDPATSDFIIQVEGQRIYIHKAILQIRSQYFKNKFQCLTENNKSIPDSSVYVVSDNFSYIVYKAFLKYLYTGTVDLPLDTISELTKLADEYCEINLKTECGRIIKQAITACNVAFFYGKAIEYNDEEMEEFCVQFTLCHIANVLLSEEYNKLDRNIRRKLIQRTLVERCYSMSFF